jgi:hypothetical protein
MTVHLIKTRQQNRETRNIDFDSPATVAVVAQAKAVELFVRDRWLRSCMIELFRSDSPCSLLERLGLILFAAIAPKAYACRWSPFSERKMLEPIFVIVG